MCGTSWGGGGEAITSAAALARNYRSFCKCKLGVNPNVFYFVQVCLKF